jgi:hypothetical protein
VTADLAIVNDGDDALVVAAVGLDGASAGDFTIDSGGGSFVLAPGASRALAVRFHPVALGTKSAQITVTSNDDDEPVATLALSGLCVAAPAGGDVAFVQTLGAGATSSAVVTVPAVGGPGASLYLAAVATKPLRSVVSVSGLGLGWTRVREQCAGRNQTGIEVWVAYGSAVTGPVTATLASAPSNALLEVTRYAGVDPAGPIGSIVSGNTNGVSGLCAGGVDGLAYSLPITTGVNGAWLYAAVSQRATTHTPGAGFTERRDALQGTGGTRVGIAVEDRTVATAGASAINGTFSKTVDWAAVGLEIRGVPANGPVIASDAPSHDFGAVLPGGASTTHAFVIRNDGSQDLSVTATTLAGAAAADFSVVAGPAPFTLAPGGTRSLTVRFAPASAGPKSAVLRIASNDPLRNPLDLALSGTGAAPEIAVSPASLDFGSVPRPTSSTRTVVVHNEGTSALHVTATGVEGADAAEFAIASGGGPVTIAAGGSASIEVRFTPATLGSKTALLRITSDDADEGVLDAALIGQGIDTSAAGPVLFEAAVGGGSSGVTSVSTAGPVTAGAGRLYLAAITAKPHRTVASVAGLGLAWTEVATQCGGRSQTGVSLWRAFGTPSGDGAVTATLASSATNAVIVVASYSGADAAAPLGATLSGNTLGAGGACSGGVDGTAYSFPLTTTAPGAVVFSAAAMRTKTHAPGAGFTERTERAQGIDSNTASAAVMDMTFESPSLATVAGTFSGAVDWAMIAVEVRPGATAAAVRGPGAGMLPSDRVSGSPLLAAPSTFDVALHPNPFSAGTTIEYALPQPANVTVSVYDATGRLVRRLAESAQPAGLQRVRWEGDDSSGRRVAPGVYFVRVGASGAALTRKVVLRR